MALLNESLSTSETVLFWSELPELPELVGVKAVASQPTSLLKDSLTLTLLAALLSASAALKSKDTSASEGVSESPASPVSS